MINKKIKFKKLISIMFATFMVLSLMTNTILADGLMSDTIDTYDSNEQATEFGNPNFKVTCNGGADGDGMRVSGSTPMKIESKGSYIINKVELTVGYNAEASNEITTLDGTLSGNAVGCTLITCSDINKKDIEFKISGRSVVYIKQVKVYYSTKTAQTLTFVGATDDTVTKTYGDANFTQTVTGANTTVTYSSSDTSVATINSSTGEVTILKAGTTTIKASAAENDTYAAAEKTYTLTVDQKAVTITGSRADGKKYDGTKTATVHLGTVSGIITGDDATVNISGEFASADAGNEKEVALTYTLAGTKASNYTITSANSTTVADIEKRPITLTSNSGTKEYDGTALTNAYVTYDALAGGESFAIDPVASGTITKVGQQTNTIDISSLQVKKGSEDTTANYEFSKDEGTLTVTPKSTPITITTPTPESKTYDGSAIDAGTATSNFDSVKVDGDTISIPLKYTGTDAVKDAGVYNNDIATHKETIESEEVVVYSYKVTNEMGEDVTNCYTFAKPTIGTLTISPKSLTVSGYTISDKYYDGTNKANVTNNGTLSGTITDDDVSIDTVTATYDDETVGINKTVTLKYTLKGAAKDNYSLVDQTICTGVIKEMELGLDKDGKSDNIKGASVKLDNIKEVYKTFITYKDNEVNHSIKYPLPSKFEVKVNNNPSGATYNQDITNILKVAKGNKYQGYVSTVELTYNDGEEKTEEIKDTKGLLKIEYDFDFTNKVDVQFFRVHNGVVEELTTTPNADGEYIVLDKANNKIIVYSRYYSTYAITYNNYVAPTYNVVKTGVDGTNNSLKLVSLLSLVTIAGIVTLKKRKH